ncbi:MAG: hypothetical protein V5A60_10665 [Haloarculaceae archaeon]
MTGDTRQSWIRTVARGARYAVAAVFVTGIRRRNPGAVVNAAVSYLATFLPSLVGRYYGVEFRPWQRAYLNTGLLAHAVGMLGPYDDVWWWDHVTHVYSATLLGGLIHLSARHRNRDPTPRVLAGVLGAGALWELVEYAIHGASRRVGLEPLLVSYGRTDTLLDLLFDLVGALLVLAVGDRLVPASRRDGDQGSEDAG